MPISTLHARLHRWLAIVLIAVPWLFGFESVPGGRNVFVGVGLAMLIYPMLRICSPVLHLGFDLFAGFFLMIAPDFFQYSEAISEIQAMAHLTAGLLLWGVVAITLVRRGIRPSIAVRLKLPGGIPRVNRQGGPNQVPAAYRRTPGRKRQYPRARENPRRVSRSRG
jgi:hypothetical protein